MANNDGGGGKSQDQETDGDRETSGKAFLGYEFNKAFSLEAGGAGFNFNIGKHMGLRFERGRFKITNHDTDIVSANMVHYFR